MKSIWLLMLAAAVMRGEPNDTNSLATRDGADYQNVTIQKVTPDGVTIEYRPAVGTFAMAYIKTDRLPDNWQQQFTQQIAKATAASQREDKSTRAMLEHDQWLKTIDTITRPEREAQQRRNEQLVQRRLQQEEMERRQAAAEAERKRQEEIVKLQRAREEEIARQQKATDDAAFWRWQVQDNQLDSIDRGIKELNWNLRRY